MVKILLHACCGPCSLEPTRLMAEEGTEFAVYFANSNIHPADEYARRLDVVRELAQQRDYPLIEGAYNVEAWEATVGAIGRKLDELRAAADIEGEVVDSPNPYPLPPLAAGDEATEGARAKAAQLRKARCRACYRLRFQEAADYAKSHGFDALGTTLSVSPFQYTQVIAEELEQACAAAGIQCAFVDYRPHFEENERLSKEMGIYRQNYCGCHFSDEEAQLERAVRKAWRKAKKAAKKGDPKAAPCHD